MDEIKKTMLAMKNEKDAATDKADQLETTYLEAKEEQDKVSSSLCLCLSDEQLWFVLNSNYASHAQSCVRCECHSVPEKHKKE